MENQYCKVGSSTSLSLDSSAIGSLEHQYNLFMEKASSIKYTDAELGAFFESKASKIKKILESLI
ncbi:MAG: hypothetical protein V7724_10805 [Sediminicola sp.]|tara:strand:- start:14770 stop:14964 length:195 start_codon:yes stop_codon:yes gene_type:complete